MVVQSFNNLALGVGDMHCLTITGAIGTTNTRAYGNEYSLYYSLVTETVYDLFFSCTMNHPLRYNSFDAAEESCRIKYCSKRNEDEISEQAGKSALRSSEVLISTSLRGEELSPEISPEISYEIALKIELNDVLGMVDGMPSVTISGCP